MTAQEQPAVPPLDRVRAYDPNGFGAYARVDVIERSEGRVRVRFDDGSDMWLSEDDIEDDTDCGTGCPADCQADHRGEE